MGKLYMGFDAGTQSVKVAVYDENFSLVASHALPTQIDYPQPGWVQMDVDNYLDNCVECMRLVVEDLRSLGRDPAEVAATHGRRHHLRHRRYRRKCPSDHPVHQLPRQPHDAGREALNAKKLDIWGRETGNPEASPMFPAMFARWFLKNSPAFVEKGEVCA